MFTFPLIPRTKVNFGFKDLFMSLFINESHNKYSKFLIKQLGRYFKNYNIILTPSGRGGLYLILKSIHDKNKVIIPSYTCKVVTEAAMLARKKVIYSEVSEIDFNFSLKDLESVIDSDSIVIATHQYGIPCQIDLIKKMCDKHGAILIEDCAASFGSKYKGKLTGTFGDYSFFSFDSTKLINVPLKAGFIIIKDKEKHNKIFDIYKREMLKIPFKIKLTNIFLGLIYLIIENPYLYRLFHLFYFKLRNKYTVDNAELYLNKNQFYLYRISEWQSFIALRQVGNINEIINKRNEIFKKYHTLLSGIEKLNILPFNEEWVCIRFPILVNDKLNTYNNFLKKGFDVAFSFSFMVCPNNFVIAKNIANKVLNLPYYYKLTDKEIFKIIKVIKDTI